MRYTSNALEIGKIPHGVPTTFDVHVICGSPSYPWRDRTADLVRFLLTKLDYFSHHPDYHLINSHFGYYQRPVFLRLNSDVVFHTNLFTGRASCQHGLTPIGGHEVLAFAL